MYLLFLRRLQPGLPFGDVIFVLKCAGHGSFTRSGNDLLTTIKITLSEALLGFSRVVLRHLDGRGIKVTSPANRIIKMDEAIVLRGEGMPVHNNPGINGDLYVVLSIEMPEEAWLQSANLKVH